MSDSEETASFLKNSLEDYGGGNSWIHIHNRMAIAVESSTINSPNAVDQDSVNPDGFFVDNESGCLIVSDSRIDYRRELAGNLGITWNVVEGFSDSKLILLAYLKWGGEACLSHLYGDFSFIIWDPSSVDLICARDHFGCRSLYYIDQPEYLAVASHISAFKCIHGFCFEIREQYILDSLCSIVKTESLSPYNGISRLMPAHYLKLDSGQLSDQYRYWDLRIDENYEGLKLEEASDGLRERIIEAVRQRSQTSGQIGIELSGGLDSSGIASVLAMLSGPDVTINAFTQSTSSEGVAQQMHQKSEIEFSEALVEEYSTIRQFKITGENSEGGYDSLIKALNSLNKPINLHYAINSDLLFEVAGHVGTSIIFSGLDGDEGISNSGIGYFNELIRHGQHSKLRDNIKRIAYSCGHRFYIQLIKIYIDYFAPWVFNLFKKDWRKVAYRSVAIQKSLARKYRMKKRYFHSHSFPQKADVRVMQYFRIMYPNKPERIEETALLAKKHGIEYRYPFLDVKLLEFFYSLPSEYKYKDGMGRYLFRMAMKGILPEKIRMRMDKGGNTIPNVFDRLLHDEKIFRDTIVEGRLKNQYHYVDIISLKLCWTAF